MCDLLTLFQGGARSSTSRTTASTTGSDVVASSSGSSSTVNTPHGDGRNKDATSSDSLNFLSPNSSFALRKHPPLRLHSFHINGGSYDRDRVSDVEVDEIKNSAALPGQLELQRFYRKDVRKSEKGQDLLNDEDSVSREERKLFNDGEKRKEVRYEVIRNGDFLQVAEDLGFERRMNIEESQNQKLQERNDELILWVRILEQQLEERNVKIPEHWKRLNFSHVEDESEKRVGERISHLEHRNMDLSEELEICRRDKDELVMHMEQLALDYEIMKQENHEISCKLQQFQLQEQLKLSYDGLQEQERIEEMEYQIKEKARECSELSAMISDLEVKVTNLEEELRDQARRFRSQLKMEVRAKLEEAERAKQAEEALTKTKSENAEMAGKLQEELRRLSFQMNSTFDENWKVAVKAFAEAGELRAQVKMLTEKLEIKDENLRSMKSHFKAELDDLRQQLILKDDQIQKLKATQFERETEQDEVAETSSCDFLAPKSGTEPLNDHLHPEKHEQEKAAMNDNDLKQEVERLKEEVARMERINSAKEREASRFCLESEMLKVRCDDMKRSILEDEMEKEKLRKMVFQLKVELKKREDAFINADKRLRQHSLSFGAKMKLMNM